MHLGNRCEIFLYEKKILLDTVQKIDLQPDDEYALGLKKLKLLNSLVLSEKNVSKKFVAPKTSGW